MKKKKKKKKKQRRGGCLIGEKRSRERERERERELAGIAATRFVEFPGNATPISYPGICPRKGASAS